MPEITRLSGNNDWIDLDFVERERTPEPAMKLGIQLHLARLSLSNTIFIFDKLGVQRSRKAVHDWVQKADLQPTSRKNPNQGAVDETVIRINDQQYCLYAAADPATNQLLHLRLFSTTTTALTEIFLRELRQKHDAEDAVFLVDGLLAGVDGLLPVRVGLGKPGIFGNESAKRLSIRSSRFPRVNQFQYSSPSAARNGSILSFQQHHLSPPRAIVLDSCPATLIL